MGTQADISLYDVVRGAEPRLVPHVMHKPSVLNLSRSLERRIRGTANGDGVLFGAFQRDRFFDQSKRQWIDLAGRVETAVVFTAEAAVNGDDGIAHVPTGRDLAIAREWAILYTAAGEGEGLVARELDSLPPTDLGRRFEVLRMTNPGMVRTAAEAAMEIAITQKPEVESSFPAWFQAGPPAGIAPGGGSTFRTR